MKLRSSYSKSYENAEKPLKLNPETHFTGIIYILACHNNVNDVHMNSRE